MAPYVFSADWSAACAASRSRPNAAISAYCSSAEIAALSLERDAAQAAYQSAEKTYGATQIKYQSGAINKATYLQGEASYLQKKAELETAEISLRTAYDAYEWMLKGVA